jgi:pSer/pThr/pTyr-binding forkhead associated (FHA) protein
MRLEIKVRLPGKSETESYIFNDNIIEIGRWNPTGRSVSLPLNDPSVSRKHATLICSDNQWRIRDQNSSYGTFLLGATPADETQITADTPLPPGAQLRLGNTWLMLDYDPPEIITGSQPGLVEPQHTVNPQEQATIDLDEYARLDLFSRIARIQRTTGSRQDAMTALVTELRLVFGARADHIGVIQYQDNQLLPVAYFPSGKSNVSFKLAQRAVEKRESFHWERINDPEALAEVKSLTGVISAIYTPIMHGNVVVGALHVNSTQPGVAFTPDDLNQLREIATYVGMLLMKADGVPLASYPLVFLSYSRSDTEFVRELAADLRRRGVNVWYDDRLRAGAEWLQQLATSIQTVNSFVLVISPASMQSRNVKWEIEQARAAGKKIIPLLLEPSDETMPDWLKGVQYIKVKQDYQQALARLVDVIYEPQ